MSQTLRSFVQLDPSAILQQAIGILLLDPSSPDIAIDLIAAGRAPVERPVTHRFSLDAGPEAFRVAADKATGSVKVHLVI